MATSRQTTRKKRSAAATNGDTPRVPELSPEMLLDFYRKMALVRYFEEACQTAFRQGKVGGYLHMYIGQEAIATGLLATVQPDDRVITAYRDHAHVLILGSDPKAVMAELYGKGTGLVKGKGGSMHLFDASLGFLGGHGIVGGHIPLAAGIGFAIKYREKDQVAVCFFGEAAINNGAFHEALNMAGIWKLPCIFVCENNRYGMGTALDRATATWNISERAASYDMSREVVDGQDLLEVMAAMDRAVVRARRPAAPTLLEIRTYRFVGHSMSDPIHGHYRTKEEVEAHRKRDPILLWQEKLKADGIITDEQIAAMDKEVVAEVQDAYDFADAAEDPEPDELYRDVYAPVKGDRE